MGLQISTGLYDFSYSRSEASEQVLLESHCHFRFEIIAVISGSIDIMIEGQIYKCEGGEMAVIPPLTYHSVTISEKSEYRRITALFDSGVMPQTIGDGLSLNLKGSPIYSHPSVSRLIDDLYRAIGREEAETYLPLAEAIATQMIYFCADNDAQLRGGGHGNGVLEKAIEFIDSHITEKLSLDDIAEAVFISKSSLCHVFSERMRVSPKQYVIQKKMAYATMLIKNGASLTEAARAVGYENYSNFYRMYKKTESRGE